VIVVAQVRSLSLVRMVRVTVNRPLDDQLWLTVGQLVESVEPSPKVQSQLVGAGLELPVKTTL